MEAVVKARLLTDLRLDALQSLASSLERTYGVGMQCHVSDLMNPASREELFRDLKRIEYHGLINVAGLDAQGQFLQRSHAQIQGVVRLNVEGTLAVTHQVLSNSDPMKWFWIVTVSSLADMYPMPVKATYAASKRFLLDFSLALRDEVAS